jgi:putative salt-induced outer membrane protein YdiY
MKRTLLLCLALSLACSAAAADVVTLKNGDRVTGAIVRADAKALTIKTDAMGEVAIARDAVATIAADQPLYLGLSDGQTVVGTVRTADANLRVDTRDTGSVTLAPASVQTIRSEAEQAAYLAEIERYKNPGLLDLWSGAVDLGLSLTSGNSENLNFAFGGHAVRETKRDKTSFYFAEVYGRSEVAGVSETTANAIRGGGRYEVFLSDRWTVFGFGDLEHDEFQQLDLRLVLGGGVGFYFIKNDRTEFQVFGGGNLNKEYFSDDTRRTSGEIMVGQGLSSKISDRFSFLERFAVFPNLSEGGEYRMIFDSSAVTTLNKWLAWHLTFSDRYISNPVPGSESNDILLTTGLRLSFAR